MTRAVVESAIDQGVHRFLADGVHYRDLMDIRAEAADCSSWPNPPRSSSALRKISRC